MANFIDKYFILICCFLFLALIYLNVSFVISVDDRLDNIERLKMYDRTALKNGNINGYYSYDDYYCVWTKGRNPMGINETVNHELCHMYIAKNPLHFCGDYNKSTHN